jgi:hypothetical protein
MQWFIKWVKWTSGRLGRCLRHSFGMPSIPQAFFNFNEFSIFCMTHGLILIGGFLSSASSRAWTVASTRSSWLSSHRSCGVNWELQGYRGGKYEETIFWYLTPVSLTVQHAFLNKDGLESAVLVQTNLPLEDQKVIWASQGGGYGDYVLIYFGPCSLTKWRGFLHSNFIPYARSV